MEREILDEVTRHLVANVPGFTEESGKRLVSAMNAAFPYAEVEPTVEHYQRLMDFSRSPLTPRSLPACAERLTRRRSVPFVE